MDGLKSTDDLQAEHARAAEAAAAQGKALARQGAGLAIARLVLFAGLVLVAAGAMAAPGAWPIVIASAMLLAFLALALVHAAVDQRRAEQRRREDWHRRGIERCHGRFPESRAPADPDTWHPFAADLDLLGSNGLLARLDSGAGPVGRAQLARWALADEQLDPILQQSLVRSLVPARDWRVGLAVAADVARGDQVYKGDDVDPRALAEWLTSTTAGPSPVVMIGIWCVRLLGIAGIAALTAAVGVPGLLLGVLIAGVILTPLDGVAVARMQLPGAPVVAAREIRAQAAALQRVAQIPVTAGDTELQRLADSGRDGAQGFGQIGNLLGRTAARANPMRALLGAVVLAEWSTWSGVTAWRAQQRDSVASWLATLGQAEALACLATWAEEQGGAWPDCAFDGGLEATGLAHPLLPAERRVANDIEIAVGQVLLLTGANASGKSTFLRSIALAAVMARIGLPVCATACRLRLPRVATVMRVGDDLLGGRSRFQAEVLALRKVLDLAEAESDSPLLLALDEILAGTNSRERHIGTKALLAHLDQRAVMALVTTHDLELVSLAEIQPERIQLAHFADRAVLADEDPGEQPFGDVVFDYRLRSGPLTSTNAVRVMRAAGLPVGNDG